ncbi:hypothetical protein DEIPH_ctg037orf0035 [Deinococcus phoenicis]|uniref:Uncharacterized protein n=1 Tax=Deinococcus phoenicis TaxID=1476583 RepID=A0A016QNY0_9DEIO|nr:hypothetical protein [Deinococcus phoenicis]EYB67547.1 hypothetical protein DEIPH_ctg037orf0035 [Deinococcus phoenicis]
MSELTSANRHGNLGRTLLWVAILLSLLLLGFVTALTVRNNPYYSDRDANGVSKYRFLEECKEGIHSSEQLTTLKGVLQQAGQLQPNQSLHAEIAAEPRQLVQSVQTVPSGGWTLSAPANISIQGQTAVLGQLGAQCVYDKAQGRTVAQLQLPGQQ